MSEAVLRIENLRTYFHSTDGPVRAVDGVSFELRPGETLGIVGESGCGKSITCLSVLRLIDPPGRIEPGSAIWLRDRNLMNEPEAALRQVRGNQVSMIFQEPLSSLNPVWTIGEQIAEAVRLHRKAGSAEARARAVEMLRLVGIPDPEQSVNSYPHQFSGGMRQRAMIAMALACDPAVLLADEPTTALDVTIQAQILELLANLQRTLGMAMIFVSHDLGVIAEIADRVIVMYAGQVVERGTTDELFRDPKHPYTEGLLRSIPRVTQKLRRLAVIPGSVPSPRSWPPACRFHPRCPYAWERCRSEAPPLAAHERAGRCWLDSEPERRVAGAWDALGGREAQA
ncbi:MAG: ABC transporter ATP-binding protein [Gemmatimonadota bacterium]|nr:MAG: ABC transporter ATP-binding protein [Gemmatimonadota bacterium]